MTVHCLITNSADQDQITPYKQSDLGLLFSIEFWPFDNKISRQ